MKKKIFMILLITVLFGLFATTSVFAGPRPLDGRYVQVNVPFGQTAGEIQLFYKPNDREWIIQIYEGSKFIAEYRTTNFNDSTNYIITGFSHKGHPSSLNWAQNTLWFGVGYAQTQYKKAN